MRRFRLLAFDFDSRPLLLAMSGPDDPDAKKHWEEGRAGTVRSLAEQFGTRDLDAKMQNYIDFGPLPFSVLAYHNQFVREVQAAFVVGAYYPALTGATTLTERILNYLVIGLRERYPVDPGDSRVRRKGSFDDWDFMIGMLDKWQVLEPIAKRALSRLNKLRNDAVHWGSGSALDWRTAAIDAARQLAVVIDHQFGLANGRYFIPGIPGETYIRKEAESHPYAAFVYIPNASLVGPNNRVEFEPDQVVIVDDDQYEDREITDEEFARLHIAARDRRLAGLAEDAAPS